MGKRKKIRRTFKGILALQPNSYLEAGPAFLPRPPRAPFPPDPLSPQLTDLSWPLPSLHFLGKKTEKKSQPPDHSPQTWPLTSICALMLHPPLCYNKNVYRPIKGHPPFVVWIPSPAQKCGVLKTALSSLLHNKFLLLQFIAPINTNILLSTLKSKILPWPLFPFRDSLISLLSDTVKLQNLTSQFSSLPSPTGLLFSPLHSNIHLCLAKSQSRHLSPPSPPACLTLVSRGSMTTMLS